MLYMCSLSCLAQITINPIYDRTSFEVLHPHVDRVELKKDSTKVYCSISYLESFSYNIPKTMFIEDTKNNKKYKIIKCIGLPFEPEERVFNFGGTFQFIFCFPHIDGLQKFNLIEDSSRERFFNIYGIDISTSYPQTFEEAEYKRFKNMSDFYKSSGDINKYVVFEEKELLSAQYIFGSKSLAASDCYHQLAQYCNATGNHAKAIKLGLLALECDSILFGVENKEYPVYVTTLGNLSRYYLDNGSNIEALHYKQKCIGIWRNIGSEENYLKEIYSLLFSGRDMIGIEKRIDIVEHEFANLPDFVNATSKSIAIILKQLALYYWMIDDNNGAIRCCDKAIVIYNINRDTNSEEFADLLSVKCKYQSHSGLSKEAVVTGERAKQLFDSLYVKSIKYAELLSDLAWAYGTDYNFEKSITLQIISTEIYEEAKDWLSLAEAYNKVSDYYQRAEKLDSAELYIKKAIAVLNNHNDVNLIIREDAERLGDNSIVTPFAISKIKQRLDYDKINFLQTLAGIFQKEGKITDAINTGKETLILTKNTGDNHAYALHLMIMAQYYLLDKQYINAKDCVEQTFQLDEPPYNIANNKIMLSHICFEMGDTIEALRYAKEAASFFKAKGYVENLITTEYVLALFYWKSHEYTKAEQHLFETLDLLRDNICKEFTRMTSEQKQRIWGIYEKYFLLYRHIIEKSRNDGLLLSRLFDYVLFSKSLLLDTGIQSDANRLMITWKDIQHQLSDDDLAIEFISTIGVQGNYNTYHALVIDKNNPNPRMITLYSERELEEIKKTTTRNISDIVGELIWKPILVQYSNAKNIYFSPDGILHILPIEYYNVNSTTNMFGQYNMYRLSSTKELIGKHSQKQFSSAVLYGGLDYNQLKETTVGTSTKELPGVWRGIANRGGFDPLFNTLVETQEIKDLLDSKNIVTTLYSGEKGTEESFRNLSNQKYNIIHLATHGMYVNPDGVDTKKTEDNFAFLETLANTNDPVKEDAILTHSFLVMAGGNRLVTRDYVSDSNDDGILTSQEISQLDLRGLDLVVLSACESALGDIENGGVYGLQRGFKKAGANTILMSLDKVDDEATKIIMVEFYKNLMAGKSKQQSLKDAQRYLRQVEDGKYDAPKYWASFIMLDGLN